MQNATNHRILSKPMGQKAAHFRNVHGILATCASLVLLVSLALGWLGWRLLAQEETLQRQQAHTRLEQRADALLTGFLRRIEEKKAWLSGLGSALPPDATATQPGAIGVSFSSTGIQVQPPGQLLYYPATPQPAIPDSNVFAQAAKLEFQSTDYKGAGAALAPMATSNDAYVRSEALLRLARVQKKSGQLSEALSTYAKLQDETLVGPNEEPYALSSRLARTELLASLPENAKARQEASALLASLEAGHWPISKGTFASVYSKVRELAGQPAESHALDAKLAVAAAVESAWDAWQLQRSGSRTVTTTWHSSGPVPVLAIMNANAERLVSLIYVGERMRELGLDGPSLTDEHGQTIFGPPTEPNAMQVAASLSAAELPWQLHMTAAGDDSIHAFSKERRNYLVFALVVIVLLVSLACYAMARGVLREAAAGRLQSDFVSAVSHEFRSPLTTLRQLTELLAEGRIHEEGRRRQYFSVLQKETSRLHHLVEDLLDFGRIDAGRRQYRLEPHDFSELVQDGIEDYQMHAGSNGHKIEVSPRRGQLIVDADREAMRRVVRNLLENAAKYSPDATTVWVKTDCEDRDAVLHVRDEGIGIPAEETSRIFEKFVRGEAAKRACIPGTGVGLAMVKEIVRVHRGDVELSSEVGRGSTFTVRLPLRGTQ